MALKKNFATGDYYYYVRVSSVQSINSDSKDFTFVTSKIIRENYISEALADPPGSPTTGDKYLLPASSTGAWATHDGETAEWNGSTWDFGERYESPECTTTYKNFDVSVVPGINYFSIAQLNLGNQNGFERSYEYLKNEVEAYLTGWTDV
jgi:hypothetical protein